MIEKLTRADRKAHAQEFIRRHRDAVLKTFAETKGDWHARMEATKAHMYRILRGLSPQNRHLARRIEIAVVRVLKEAETKVMARRTV